MCVCVAATRRKGDLRFGQRSRAELVINSQFVLSVEEITGALPAAGDLCLRGFSPDVCILCADQRFQVNRRGECVWKRETCCDYAVSLCCLRLTWAARILKLLQRSLVCIQPKPLLLL